MDPALRARLPDAYPGPAARCLSDRRELGAARIGQGDELQPRRRADGRWRPRPLAVFPHVRSGALGAHTGGRAGARLLDRLLRQEPRGAIRERRRPERCHGADGAPRPTPRRASLPPSRRTLTRPDGPGAGADGVDRTTLHAGAAPRPLGSIPARHVRRRLWGTAPIRPPPHPPPARRAAPTGVLRATPPGGTRQVPG